MYRLLFFTCLLLLNLPLIAQERVETDANGITKGYDNEGKLIMEGKLKNNQRNGVWTFYYERYKAVETYINDVRNGIANYYALDGHKVGEGNFINDKRNGPWKYYATSGVAYTIQNYKNGVIEGHVEYYDSVTSYKIASGEMFQDKKVEIWKTYFNDQYHQISSTQTFENDLPNGSSTEYDSVTHSLLCFGNYLNGNPDGLWIMNTRNGKLQFKINYQNGIKNGVEQVFDTSMGYLQTEWTNKNDLIDGEWKMYYSNTSKIDCIVNYVNGIISGSYLQYDSLTGNLITEGQGIDGKRIGLWKRYYSDGIHLASEINCKDGLYNGKCTYYDSATGKRVTTGRYVNDERDGEWEYFHPSSGSKRCIENYKNGLLSGEVIEYDSIGNKIVIMNYKDNKRHGKWKIYYDNSNDVWIDVNYVNDSLQGERKVYYPSGKLKRKDILEKGKMPYGHCYAENGVEIDYYRFMYPTQFEKDVQTYIGDNLQYPKEAMDAKIEGKVLVRFVVNENGKVSDVEVLKGIGYGCDEEAVRLVSHMPPWIPMQLDGKPYATYQTLPIVFWIH